MAKETVANSDVNYPEAHKQGKCPRCNHMAFRMEQAGSMPPRHHCPICGWSDFDMKGFKDPGIFREAKANPYH